MTRRRESRRPAVEAVPLGSISQQPDPFAPGTLRCATCGSTDLVRIRMGAPNGRPMVFVSCRACERTAWFARDGDGTPLASDGSPLVPTAEPDEPPSDAASLPEPFGTEPDEPHAGAGR